MFLGVGALIVLRGQRRERELAVVEATHVAERARHQRELLGRDVLVQRAVDALDVDAGFDQVRGHEVRARAGVLVHEAAGVGDQADVEGFDGGGRGRDAERVHEVPHDLGGRRGGRDDVVERAEVGVVVVVVDVQQARAAAKHARGVAVDVAAVEEHDGALGDVGGRRLNRAAQVEHAVLGRQRQVVAGDEDVGLLPNRAEQLLHADERAEGVAVGVLVGGEDELRVMADVLEHLFARRAVVGWAHCASPSRSSCSSRSARSVVSS